VKFSSGPSSLVVASSSEEDFLELVHEEGVERSGKRNRLKVALCNETKSLALPREIRQWDSLV